MKHRSFWQREMSQVSELRKRIRSARKAIKYLSRFYSSDSHYVTPHMDHIRAMLEELAALERLVIQKKPETVTEQLELPF